MKFLIIILLSCIPFLGICQFNFQPQPMHTQQEWAEILSNKNYELVQNRSFIINFSNYDKNLQGEIKDELTAIGESIYYLNLDENTSYLRIRFDKNFSLKELIEILEHFGINDTSIIMQWN